jgi:SOS-response transcriptional repressor LexA
MTEREPLTDKQRAVLVQIVTLWGTYGTSPTLRELSAALGFSGGQPNAVSGHLKALARKGWIVWERSPRGTAAKSRGIVVTELLAAAQAAARAYLEGLSDGQ